MKNINASSYIQLVDVGKSYGEKQVLDDLQISVSKGEFVSIVGKSGCGKSTLLRLIAGLEQPSARDIMIDNCRVRGIPEDVRIIFQNGRLLPWKTVLQNVTLGLTKEAHPAALKALEQVYLAERKDEWPSILSGGQQQRVNLPRPRNRTKTAYIQLVEKVLNRVLQKNIDLNSSLAEAH